MNDTILNGTSTGWDDLIQPPQGQTILILQAIGVALGVTLVTGLLLPFVLYLVLHIVGFTLWGELSELF